MAWLVFCLGCLSQDSSPVFENLVSALPVFPGEKVQANFSHFVRISKCNIFNYLPDLAFSLNKTFTKYQTDFSAVSQTKKSVLLRITQIATMPSLSTYSSQACILNRISILWTRRIIKLFSIFYMFNIFETTDRSFILEVYFTGKSS